MTTGITGKEGYTYQGFEGYCLKKKFEGTIPLYRYFRKKPNKDHFYTTNKKELKRKYVLTKGEKKYKPQGIVCYIFRNNVRGGGILVPLYRAVKKPNGDHLYTTKFSEIGSMNKKIKGESGYYYDGKMGYLLPRDEVFHKVAEKLKIGLYRSFNRKTKDQMYTTTLANVEDNYISDGIEGYCFDDQLMFTKPLFKYVREYPIDHIYTIDEDIMKAKIVGDIGKWGYKYEGIVCYVFDEQIPGSSAFLRYKKAKHLGKHLYTTDDNEIGVTTKGKIGKNKYKFQKIEGYLMPK